MFTDFLLLLQQFSTLQLVVLILASFVTAIIPSIAGFGGGVSILAVFSFFLEPKTYIPMVAVIMAMTSLLRVRLFWEEVQWPVIGRFLVGMIPASLMGVYVFNHIPGLLLKKLLGVFLIAFSLWSSVTVRLPFKLSLKSFPLVGAIVGFVCAVVGGAGPLTATCLLSYGLMGLPFVATSITGQLSTHTINSFAFGYSGALPGGHFVFAFCLGLLMMPGVYLGKWFASFLSPKWFRRLILALLLVVGLRFVLSG